MSKIIYGVFKHSGEWEDYRKELVKCFPTIDAANNFRDFLEKEEEIDRLNSKRCKECGGLNKECPLWVEPFDDGGECLKYYNRAWHDEETYTVEEVPYEETDENS